MKPDPLFLSDEQIADRVGLSTKDWEIAKFSLERGGFPMKDPVFANKRYWPACRAFLDRRYGLASQSALQTGSGEDGEETWSRPNRTVKPRSR